MAMTDQEILTGLGEIIDEVAGVPAEEVTPEKSFVDDLDIDSLSMVEIAVAAQDKFGVEIPDDQLKNLKTVRDVVISAGYAVIGRWRERYDPLDAARADALLAALGLRGLGARAYGTLSEGERKRALIARALMTDPELLLLDEPAAGLDLGGREDLVARLSLLANDAEAPASVLVTHHVEEIPPGYSHGLLLREGRVVAAGLLDDVLTDENLSVTFGLPLAVQRRRGRYTAWLR